MSRMVVKCPVCEHKESVISTSMNAEMPPCPRCEAFVRMADVTPAPNQKTVISTGGSRGVADASAESAPPSPATPGFTPQRRDPRDFGPEPRA